jgi:hydroxymethylpyrimidine pyrophosphatase-like HAD family hydrolase/energy-coupling factor transporter ATP-binding protein EcfA2
MRYVCAIFDYDGTLATEGHVSLSTLQSLEKLHKSGRKLILATGRRLKELIEVFPKISLFHYVVAENGGVMYEPSSRNYRVLTEPPSHFFVEELRRRGVTPISVGDSVVATWRPNEQTVLDVIRDEGLGLQVILNKDAVMVLPSGVSKATGLMAALEETGLSFHNAVGIGDAENDHAFLNLCECSVAVANALPSLRERADYVTSKTHGQGAEELIERILKDDLASLDARVSRHGIRIGHNDSGQEFRIDAFGARLFVVGPSGAGKSTTVSALLERIIESRYQVCLIDPEGDYDALEQLVTLGGPEHAPTPIEILDVLKKPESSLSINLLGVPVAERPSYFASLLPTLNLLQNRTGRPHWVVLDEAHHILSESFISSYRTIPEDFANLLIIAVHPNLVSRVILDTITGLLVMGPDPCEAISEFNAGLACDQAAQELKGSDTSKGRLLVWIFGKGERPQMISVEPAKVALKRHRRKYEAGELGEDKSFYFRGSQGKLNLRAQNLRTFIQLAEGVDDDTWLYHLREAHYSQWFRDSIKDDHVAEEISKIERNTANAEEGKAQIIKIIENHYTAAT